MTEFKKWLDHNKLYLEAAYKVLNMEGYTLRAWELAQPQWQPIETAPKGAYSEHKDDLEWVDPPRILLSTPGGGGHRILGLLLRRECRWAWVSGK